MSAVSASVHSVPAPDPIRVMVVDDSVVARGLMARWIADEPDLEIVASLRTGRQAVDWLAQGDADVAVLDVDMPELDGLSALPLLLARKPDLVVIMASTLTRRNAEIGLKALSLGAADCIAKPEAGRGAAAAAAFRRELVEKIRHIGLRRGRLRRTRARVMPGRGRPGSERMPGPRPISIRDHESRAPVVLRPAVARPPRVLLIGASTGGPHALMSLLPQLGGVADRVPILVVQHMPPTFTTILAEHIQRASGRPAREGVDGEAIVSGTIYVAPGGRHMRVAMRGGRPIIRLDDGPPINFCKPAVDPLFESACAAWGARALAIILTGMGSDGTRGARAIAAAGGTVIAQDEATSVVWGMPGSAVQAGVCSAVLPLDQIAPEIARAFSGDAL